MFFTKEYLLSVWSHKGPSIFNLGLTVYFFELGLNVSGLGVIICLQDESQDSSQLFVTITGNERTLLNEFLRTPTRNYNFRDMKALWTLKYLKREGVDMADGPGWLPQT